MLTTQVHQLTGQYKALQEKIKALEEALKDQGQDADLDPTPLQQRETAPTTSLELLTKHGGRFDSGLSSSGKDNEVTAGADINYLQGLVHDPSSFAKLTGKDADSRKNADPEPVSGWDIRDAESLGMPADIVDLVDAFPMGLTDCPLNKSHFTDRNFLPTRSRGFELVELYYRNISWMYDPIIRSDFMTTVFDPIYGSNELPSVTHVHAHRMSILLIVVATGALYDKDPYAMRLAHQYNVLARAALSLDPIAREANTASFQALYLIMRFTHASDSRDSEERFILGGMCAKLAQIIGLQRDSAGWNLDKDEIQRRRVAFWEFFTYDSWTSLVCGRPPSMSLGHTDCRFPDDLDPEFASLGMSDCGFLAWKFRYTATCISPSVRHVFSTQALPYSELLELDKKIRRWGTNQVLEKQDLHPTWSADSTLACKQCFFLTILESNLIYIHRSYFVQAIRAEPLEPMNHKFGPSVLAAYNSACRTVSALNGLFEIHPDNTRRQWYLWSVVFSACIILGALIVESPQCSLSGDALKKLEEGVPFYEAGSPQCRPPATAIGLRKLLQRAQAAFGAVHTNPANPTSSKPVQSHHNSPDDLVIHGSRGSVTTNKASSLSPVSYDFATPANQPGHSFASTDRSTYENLLSREQRVHGASQIHLNRVLGPPGITPAPWSNTEPAGYQQQGPSGQTTFPSFPEQPGTHAPPQFPGYTRQRVDSRNVRQATAVQPTQHEIWRTFEGDIMPSGQPGPRQ